MCRRLVLAFVVVLGCGSDDDGSDPVDASPDATIGEPLFPADYASSYTEVRDCRRSGDHVLHYVRVLADSAALEPYRDRAEQFPEGAIVLKEEYDASDELCAEPIQRWTVMVKRADGSAPEKLDWTWQDLNSERLVVSQDAAGCYNCHTSCGQPPDGYGGTCAVP